MSIATAIQLSGPSGQIEGLYREGTGSQCAVICHPHPLYGGSMHDRIVTLLESGLADAGFHTVRFNFRGVGHSEGAHDKGAGESEDVLAVSEWLTNHCRCSSLTLAGYSFGAIMALNTAARSGADSLILVAPPVTMMEVGADGACRSLVILGEEDQVVPFDEARLWFEERGAQVVAAPGADHFFSTSEQLITNQVQQFAGQV